MSPITGGGGGGGGEVFVHRGDPSTWDFIETDLTIDQAWHELDLSSIITDEDATAVYLLFLCTDNVVNQEFRFRDCSQSNANNAIKVTTQAANVNVSFNGWIALTEGRKVDYWCSNGVTYARVTVSAWLKPG